MGEHTREIQIAGRNRWYRGYISVDSQWNVNDTTTRLRVTAAIDDKYAAEYGTHYDVVVNGSVRSSRDVVLNNYGNWATRDAVTFDVDVPRGASGWNCPVQVHVYGKTYNNYYGVRMGAAARLLAAASAQELQAAARVRHVAEDNLGRRLHGNGRCLPVGGRLR